MMEDQLPQFIEKLSMPGALVAIAWILKPIWGALASWIKRDTDDGRIETLDNFRIKAETNHFHDLEDLLEDRKEIWKAIDGVRRDLSEQGKNIAYIRGKLGNGYNP